MTEVNIAKWQTGNTANTGDCGGALRKCLQHWHFEDGWCVAIVDLIDTLGTRPASLEDYRLLYITAPSDLRKNLGLPGVWTAKYWHGDLFTLWSRALEIIPELDRRAPEISEGEELLV